MESREASKPTSRRTFLKKATAVIAAATATALGISVWRNQSEPTKDEVLTPKSPTKVLPTVALSPIANEKHPSINENKSNERVVFGDIEIIGADKPISTQDDFLALERRLSEGFDLRVKQAAEAKGIKVPSTRAEKRELVMPVNERLLHVFVTKRVFDKFQKEKQSGSLDFTEWFQKHIDQMNSEVKENPNSSSLRAVFKRVIIVDDSYDDRLKTKKELPPTLIDVDGSWFTSFDYRGDINPQTGKEDKSAYIRRKNDVRGEYSFDYGLKHELFHALFNWPDEYTQNVEAVPGVVDFLLEGSSNYEVQTPWLGACLQRIQRLGIRGYYTDPRALGIAGYKDVKDSAYKVWAEITSENELNVSNQNGAPVGGLVSISRLKFTKSDYYTPKQLEPVQNASLGKPLILDKNVFNRQAFPEDDKVIYPLDYLIEVKSGDNNRQIHMPMAIFNLAKLAGGLDKAVYDIKLYNQDVSRAPKKQILHMMQGEKLAHFVAANKPAATLKIPGTETHCVWVNEI